MDAGFFYTIYSIGMKRIAIQGTLGSYHDIAAHKYFEGEEIELICCANFEDVFAAIRKDSQTIGMLAIETRLQEACCTTTNCCAKAAHKLSANINYAFRTASFACPKRTGMTLPR